MTYPSGYYWRQVGTDIEIRVTEPTVDEWKFQPTPTGLLTIHLTGEVPAEDEKPAEWDLVGDEVPGATVIHPATFDDTMGQWRYDDPAAEADALDDDRRQHGPELSDQIMARAIAQTKAAAQAIALAMGNDHELSPDEQEHAS